MVIGDDGRANVYEASEVTIVENVNGVETAKDGDSSILKTPVEEFIGNSSVDKSGKHKITVLRSSVDLTSEQKSRIASFAEARRNAKIKYNLQLTFQEDLDQCSDFVYKVYRSIGIDLVPGKEKMGDLNLNAQNGILRKAFEFINKRKINVNDPIISPFSLASSTKLKVL